MTTFNARLLTPPREEEEVYPYRRVWWSIGVESIILFGIALALYLSTRFIGDIFPRSLHRPISLALALSPAGLWLVLSLWRERLVLQPRQRLLAVALVSGLVANAVGVPLLSDFFQVERWLPLSTAVNRIIGYAFTVGIVQEILKYIVVRYMVWPDYFRTRLDAVAYAAASAIGYVTVLNLHFVLDSYPTPDVVAATVFANSAVHIVTSCLVGYGLAELHFGRPTALLLPITLALAALFTGIAIPVRTGLVNASVPLELSEIGQAFGQTRPLFGLLFSFALLITLIGIALLFSNAEREALEAEAEEGS